MEDQIFEKKLKGLNTIHMLLLVVTIFYGIVMVIIGNSNEKFTAVMNADEVTIRTIFFISIIYLFLCLFLIPHFRKKWVANYEPLNPPKYDNKGHIIDYFGMYSARFFVGISIAQLGAIFGMAIFFIGGDPIYAYGCIALCVLVIFLNGPKRYELEELREKEKSVPKEPKNKKSKKG